MLKITVTAAAVLRRPHQLTMDSARKDEMLEVGESNLLVGQINSNILYSELFFVSNVDC